MRKINTLSQDVLSIRSVGFDRQLKNKRLARTAAYAGLAIMLLYAVACILPPIGKDDTSATTKPSVVSDTVLSISIDDPAISLELTPTSASGTFATTSTPINVAVATNNITGYTVGIKASSNNDTATMLVNSVEQCEDTPTSAKCSIGTIGEAVSATDYAAATATELNNTWGYLPSKYNSAANENYLPAPTSAGDIIDATNAPNTPQSGYPEGTTNVNNLTYNEYTIDLGARLDYTPYAGSYTNTFVITAVGNPVPFSVTYEANAPSGMGIYSAVRDVPTPQIGTVTGGNAMFLQLSTKVPNIGNLAVTNTLYDPYVFAGWCTVQPEVPAEYNGETNSMGYQVCPDSATLYQPGDSYGIDQLQAANTEILYATWGAPAKVTFDGNNGLVFNDTATDTTNVVEYIPVYEGNVITGAKSNVLREGAYAVPAPLTTSSVNYVFKGWSTDADATEPTYATEQDIIDNLDLYADDDVTLYAVWAYTTIITFDGNGSDGGTAMEPITVEAGQTVALPANTYTKSEALFNGWNTVAIPSATNPGNAYGDEGDYIAGSGSQNVTLYAQWKSSDLYDVVQSLAKKDASGNEITQSAADIQLAVTAPNSTDPTADTSNSGVYKYNAAVFGASSDANNDYDIYYYRGILEPAEENGTQGSDGSATTYPNYVRLGNDTCWRIVRTTGSGGVKMVYNGVWNTTSNTCANAATAAQTGTSAFNSSYNNAIYVGYTYNNAMVGNTDTSTSVDTVFGSSSDPTLNNTRSNIKTYIEDTWYANKMMTGSTDNYVNLLEPSAGYCNDRTVYDTSWNTLTEIIPQQNVEIRFGARRRVGVNGNKVPSLTCPRGDVDLYRYVSTTSATAFTSNELRHPAALLTADEVSLAGSGYNGILPYNAKSFLNSGSYFWLLSPYIRSSNGGASEFFLRSSSSLDFNGVNVSYGVRPAISLKPGTYVTSGNGTATSPWTINE